MTKLNDQTVNDSVECVKRDTENSSAYDILNEYGNQKIKMIYMKVVITCKKDSQTVPGRLCNRDCLWFTIFKNHSNFTNAENEVLCS